MGCWLGLAGGLYNFFHACDNMYVFVLECQQYTFTDIPKFAFFQSASSIQNVLFSFHYKV